jgi:hypothetical protein
MRSTRLFPLALACGALISAVAPLKAQTPGVIPVGITNLNDPGLPPPPGFAKNGVLRIEVRLSLAPGHPKLGDEIALQSFYKSLSTGALDPGPTDDLKLKQINDYGNYFATEPVNLKIKKKAGNNVVVIATGKDTMGVEAPKSAVFSDF